MTKRHPTSQATRHGALALWFLLVLPFSAFSGTTEGVSWLTTQQTANGSFGSTPASLATPQQTTAEAVRALQLLGQQAQPVYTPALNYLYADAEMNTEFLARKIVANSVSRGAP